MTTRTFDDFWIDVVREKAAELGVTQLAVTWPTLDGEVTVDFRPDDFLKVTFMGADRPHTFVLAPDWAAS